MSQESAFAVYQMFLALKQHFASGNYDYFKYHGKIKTNMGSFQLRKDRHFYEKISRTYSPDELVDFFVSNLINNSDIWIGELTRNKECDQVYLSWKERKQQLVYFFKNDIQGIAKENFDGLFVGNSNEHPELLNLYTEGTIALETLIGIDLVVECFKDWNGFLSDDIIWQDLFHLCSCYRPFLDYNDVMKKKFRTILREEFHRCSSN